MKNLFIITVTILSIAAYSQLGKLGKAHLDKINLNAPNDNVKVEGKAVVDFVFDGNISKYYHARKGNKIIVDFYSAYCDGIPIRHISNNVIESAKIYAKSENLVPIEEIQATMEDFIRVEFLINDGIDFHYEFEGTLNLISLSIMTGKEGEQKQKTEPKKIHNKKSILYYATIVATVGIVVTLAVYIKNNLTETPSANNVYVK